MRHWRACLSLHSRVPAPLPLQDKVLRGCEMRVRARCGAILRALLGASLACASCAPTRPVGEDESAVPASKPDRRGGGMDDSVSADRGGGSPGGGGRGPGGRRGRGPGLGCSYYPGAPAEDQDADLEIATYDASLGFPLWRGGKRRLFCHARFGLRQHSGDVVMPETGNPLPDELYSVSVGLGYSQVFDQKEMLSVMLNAGSASDAPFGSVNETTLGAMAFYRLPVRERDAWMFFLVYSNTSALTQMVFPGVVYFWHPNDRLRMQIGLPFLGLGWTPNDRWSLEMSVNPAPGVNACVSFSPNRRLHLYATYGFHTKGYLLEDRSDETERLFAMEERVELGCRAPLGAKSSFSVAVGYAFDRFYFEGENLWDTKDNRIDIEDGMYFTARVSMKTR